MKTKSTLCPCWRNFAAGLLVVLFLAPQAAAAQGSGSIKGHVYDKTSGDALPGANVIVRGTSLGAATAFDGSYIIRNIPAGPQRLRVSYVGYAGASLDIVIVADSVIEKDFRLTGETVQGEEVVITAQAMGQDAAINQQLSSNTITNVVSSARIKELPDVNAAESIGRLPGVAINRYGGEATAVAIRGLSPKYNTVTINGVALPATSSDDRSVDLSMISSNMLDGIELKKANTPDMDADALGGTVDLRLREAPEGFQANGQLQGGYTKLQNYTGNYLVQLGASNRFLDNKLGIIGTFNTDRNNRSDDRLNASYRTAAAVQTLSDIIVDNFTVREDQSFKTRYGGSLLGDYEIPNGKVTANGFYSYSKLDMTARMDLMDFTHNSHYYNMESNVSPTSMYIGGAGVKQDFGWIKYDISGALTGSMTDDPEDYQWQFAQENNASSGKPTALTPLYDAWKLETLDSLNTGLSQIYQYSTKLHEKQQLLSVNVQVPYVLTEELSGYVQVGGKLKWLDRLYDREQRGCGNLQYGGSWTGPVSDLVKRAEQMYPTVFNAAAESTLIASRHVWPITRFLETFGRQDAFLDGRYKMGMVYSGDLMMKLTNALRTLPSKDWQYYAVGSLGNDYDGYERYQAAYAMATLNIGQEVTILGGVRYDGDYTIYHGQSFRDIVINGNVQQPPGDMQHNTNVRTNSFLLPMVHLKIKPWDWLILRLAATETVTRPDYSMYAPITSINSYQSYIKAANGALKDSRSKNLDASLSLHEQHIGLLTISPFLKEINDLIMFTTVTRMDTSIAKVFPGELNIPKSWLPSAPQVDTWMNNPSPARYRGIEFDWQTHFWYLPSVLQGLIFNLNWTYITSTIDVQKFKVYQTTTFVPPRSYVTTFNLVDTMRTARMVDQPAHIMNMTLGYDYEGFSIRVSWLYQSDRVTYVGDTRYQDSFTSAYDRWDIAVQQRFGGNFQLYANFNNINNKHDESLQGYSSNTPTSLQYYGPTIDVGIRYNF
jgi:TonB-dependent receptor